MKNYSSGESLKNYKLIIIESNDPISTSADSDYIKFANISCCRYVYSFQCITNVSHRICSCVYILPSNIISHA
jgi:hypothetical protein